MRHFGSLLIAAVFAPSVFLLTGVGLSSFESALDDNKAVDPLGAIAALGALLLAGVLYGILVLARLSPVGPALAGLAGIGLSSWALFNIDSYRGLFDTLDVHMGGAVGEWGLGILLGIPLLATITSSRRWRKEEYAGPTYPPAPQYTRPAPPPPRPDPTWQMPAQPAYPPLPEVAPPSLRYPAASPSPAATADESPTVPIIVPPSEAPPLPKRTPARRPPTPDPEPAQQLPSPVSSPPSQDAPTDNGEAAPSGDETTTYLTGSEASDDESTKPLR